MWDWYKKDAAEPMQAANKQTNDREESEKRQSSKRRHALSLLGSLLLPLRTVLGYPFWIWEEVRCPLWISNTTVDY